MSGGAGYKTIRFVCIGENEFVTGGKIISSLDIFKIRVPEPGRYDVLIYGWKRGHKPTLLTEMTIEPLVFND